MDKKSLYKVLSDYEKYNNKLKIDKNRIIVHRFQNTLSLYLKTTESDQCRFFVIYRSGDIGDQYKDRITIWDKVYYLEDVLKIIYDSLIKDKEKSIEQILETLESRQEIYNKIDKELEELR